MLCGLLVPTAGEISILGKHVSVADVRSRMGALIEEPGVNMGWTEKENLMMQALNREVRQTLVQLNGESMRTGSPSACASALALIKVCLEKTG